jgi:hypothetical protein
MVIERKFGVYGCKVIIQDLLLGNIAQHFFSLSAVRFERSQGAMCRAKSKFGSPEEGKAYFFEKKQTTQ